jgi:ATP-dependent protease ClpP protease subunit
MKRIKEIYEAKTKIPKTKMDEILKHDLWWDAKTCLKYGLVDEILT